MNLFGPGTLKGFWRQYNIERSVTQRLPNIIPAFRTLIRADQFASSSRFSGTTAPFAYPELVRDPDRKHTLLSSAKLPMHKRSKGDR